MGDVGHLPSPHHAAFRAAQPAGPPWPRQPADTALPGCAPLFVWFEFVLRLQGVEAQLDLRAKLEQLMLRRAPTALVRLIGKNAYAR